MRRIRKARFDRAQSVERTNHQAGADQQHQRHRHLPDDQQIARAMAFFAHTGVASRTPQFERHLRPGIFQRRNQAEQQTRNHGKNECEYQRSRIQRNFLQPRQIRRANRHQKTHAGPRQHRPDSASEQSQHRTFDQQPAHDSSPPGAQRRANRQLLLPRFHSHQQQVRHIRAGDQQHQAQRAHHHPQHVADVADHLLLQRTQQRRNLPAVIPVRIAARPVRPGLHPDRQHARQVRVGLRDRHSRLQPRNSVQSKARQNQLRAIERQRRDHIEIFIPDSESRRHHPDDFARVRIDHQVPADHRAVGSEMAAPVSIAQNHALRTVRILIFRRKPSPHFWRNGQRLQQAVAHADAAHLLRFRQAGDVGHAAIPHAHGAATPAVRSADS